MLIATLLLAASFVGPAGVCLHVRPRAALALKLNKQQELARLLEQARQQRDGVLPKEPPQPKKPKPKPKPRAGPKGPQTREEMFAAMQRAEGGFRRRPAHGADGRAAIRRQDGVGRLSAAA